MSRYDFRLRNGAQRKMATSDWIIIAIFFVFLPTYFYVQSAWPKWTATLVGSVFLFFSALTWYRSRNFRKVSTAVAALAIDSPASSSNTVPTVIDDADDDVYDPLTDKMVERQDQREPLEYDSGEDGNEDDKSAENDNDATDGGKATL